MMTKTAGVTIALALVAACGGGEEAGPPGAANVVVAGTPYLVRDTMVADLFRASGTATPVQQATLSTRLMGTVTAVLVREGDLVSQGRELARIDSRDLDAKREQATAGLAAARAAAQEAGLQAGRLRALYADSAAPRAQLDAAEAGLARAQAGVRTAEAAVAELEAVAGYASIRAPFAGIVVRRHVDPGAFAAPGAPIVALEDASRLRVTATVAPEAARGVRRGDSVPVWIEDMATIAIVEGVVPAQGNLYTVNALVGNADRALLSGSAATIGLASGSRPALLVPRAAIVRQGDLAGVYLAGPQGPELRWIRPGPVFGDLVEAVSGLRAGDRVIVAAPAPVEE